MVLPLRLGEEDRPTPWATLGIAGVLIGVFVLVPGGEEAVRKGLALDFGHVRAWQIVTAAFVHASIFHLAGNLVFLLVFGPWVEDRIGWKSFLLLYGLAVVLVPLALLLEGGHRGMGVGLGASGAIAALMGFTLIDAPRLDMAGILPITASPFGFVPVRLPVWVLIVGWFLYNAASTSVNLGAVAHIAGFVVGATYAFVCHAPFTKDRRWHLEGLPEGGSTAGRKASPTAAMWKEAAHAAREERKARERAAAAQQAQIRPPSPEDEETFDLPPRSTGPAPPPADER